MDHFDEIYKEDSWVNIVDIVQMTSHFLFLKRIMEGLGVGLQR
jgi:hypothetical protein